MEELVFRRRQANKALLGMTLIISLLPLWLTLAAWLIQGKALATLPGLILEGLAEKPQMPVFFVLATVGLLISLPLMLRYQRDARLRLDTQGITLESGLGGWLGRQLEKSWPLAWNQIEQAVLHAGPQRREALLSLLSTDGNRRQVHITHWQSERTTHETIPLQWSALTMDDLGRLRASHPLLRRFEQVGVPVTISETPPRTKLGPAQSSDLTQVPEAAFVIVLMAMLATYALVDSTAFASWGYVQSAPWPWLGASAVGLALLVYPLLARSRLHKIEATALVLLLALCTLIAAYPAALRINAFTDADGPIKVEYQLENGGRLVPLAHDDAPVLIAPIDAGFWSAQKIGNHWELELSQGALGFWQYRRNQILEQVRDYYGTH
ncbi:MAG: hypothetical protein PHI49_10470 [Halothiobacillaceae bacterium]|nr:hypothetical protein [Halothiobacillaceae bacterium]